jgi:hypothetical protein
MNPKNKIIDGQVVQILKSTARVDAHEFPRNRYNVHKCGS